MGKKSSPAPPPPPDPYAAARAQAQANREAVRESAQVNRINEVTPFGNVTWTKDLYYPTRTTSFSPHQQQIYDKQNQISNVIHDRAYEAAMNMPQGAFTLGGLPQARPQDTSNVAQTYYNRVSDTLRPEFQQQRQDLERSLYNRGIDPTNQRARIELDRLDRAQNEQLGRLAGEAQLYANQEQSRQYGIDTDVRNRALQEELLKRTQDFNEASGFIQGAPALTAPQGLPPTYHNVAAPDVMGAIYNSAQMANNNWQAQQAARQSRQSGLLELGGSLASGLIALSDETQKHDFGDAKRFLGKVGKMHVGTWRYNEDLGLGTELHIGPTAQEWARLFGGNGRDISVIDAIGVLLMCVKELDRELSNLRRGVAE